MKSVLLGLLLLAAGVRADVLQLEQFSEGTVLVDAPDLTDYQLGAHLYLVPGTTHYRGIVGRATGYYTTDSTSTWGLYAFVADLSQSTGMGDERIMLRKWLSDGQTMTTIKIWSHAELGALYPSTAGWYNLGMAFEGNQITCSINGQTLPNGTWTDDSFTAGGFDVYYFDLMDTASHLSFDDVLVEVSDTALPPVTDLSITVPSHLVAQLHWSPSLGASGYRVECLRNHGSWQELGVTMETHREDGFEPGTRLYRVIALGQ